jgi:hypothetical protein
VSQPLETAPAVDALDVAAELDDRGHRAGAERQATTFDEELQVRAAEASTQVQAAELLGEELQASIASSDLADLRALAARNDVELDEVVLQPDRV